MVVRAQVVGDVARAVAELLQVLADAEPAAGAGEDDRARLGVARVLERGVELPVHLRRQRVQHLRAVEGDRRDSAVARDFDLGHDGNHTPRGTVVPWPS